MLKLFMQKIKGSLLRRIRWHLRRLNYTHNIKVHGTPISIPYINGMNCTITEPWMIELLEILLKEKEGAFIDVGVNVGQTLVKLKSISPKKQYIGFEPNPACLYYVSNLIKKNKFINCSILPVGLYTKNQVLSLDLFSNDTTDSCASLIENYRPNNKVVDKIYAPVFNFKSISNLFSFDSIAIIKIDVEGAEIEVIKCLLELVKTYRPIILLEILPVYNQSNTFRLDRQNEIERIFTGINYIFYRIDKKGDEFSSLIKIDSIGIHSDLTQCDYVVAPREMLLTHLGNSDC